MNAKVTGPQLRELRELAGLSQSQAAAIVGKEIKAIQRWESGQSVPDLANRTMLVAELTRIARERYKQARK